jgi:diaminopropionate ammonia-lyase
MCGSFSRISSAKTFLNLTPQSTRATANILVMYCNPSARSWQSQYSIDSAVLSYHETLPDYGWTPLRTLPHSVSKRLGVGAVLLKDESRRFGLPAYKILGASWACYRALTKHLCLPSAIPVSALKAVAATRSVNIYTATDGNWGRAVARTAAMLGVEAHIYVPRVMMDNTKRKIQDERAAVLVVDGDYDLAVKEAERASIEMGGLLIEDTAWPGYEEIPQVSLIHKSCATAEHLSG